MKTKLEALCLKWIEEEREYDRRCKEAANKADVDALAVYHSKKVAIHICRRELQEAAGLVVTPESCLNLEQSSESRDKSL